MELMKLNDDCMNIINKYLYTDLREYFFYDKYDKINNIRYFFEITKHNYSDNYAILFEYSLMKTVKDNLRYKGILKIINEGITGFPNVENKLLENLKDDIENIFDDFSDICHETRNSINQSLLNKDIYVEKHYDYEEDEEDEEEYDDDENYAYGYSDSEHNITYYPSDDD